MLILYILLYYYIFIILYTKIYYTDRLPVECAYIITYNTSRIFRSVSVGLAIFLLLTELEVCVYYIIS